MSILSELLKLKVTESDHDDDDGDHSPASFADLVDKFLDHHGHSFEGRRGLIAFAKLCRAIGYKDPQYFGQLDADASIGDIVEFLEDNSGAFEAMVEFIQRHKNSEWQSSLQEYLESEGLTEGLDDAEKKELKKLKAQISRWQEKYGPGDRAKKALGKEWDDCKKQIDALEKKRALKEEALKEEEQLDEKVFDEDQYTWYAWVENKPSQKLERRGGSIQLERGMRFGLRKATSKKDGTMRLVVKSRGPSIIYSIPAEVGEKLADLAVKLR